jgi:hypothetical protein
VEEVNLKEWTPHRKGKDHAKGTTNLYARI